MARGTGNGGRGGQRDRTDTAAARRRGRPLRASILYGVDTRARKQIGALEASSGRTRIRGLSGMTLESSHRSEDRWLREHEPERWSRGRAGS